MTVRLLVWFAQLRELVAHGDESLTPRPIGVGVSPPCCGPRRIQGENAGVPGDAYSYRWLLDVADDT
jgi:hypothetical protein